MAQGVLLCVDDDATVLSALQTLLARSVGTDVAVEVAESGQEALAICAELEQEGTEVSGIMFDLKIPTNVRNGTFVAIPR